MLVDKILAAWAATGIPVPSPLPPKTMVTQTHRHPPTSAEPSSSVNNANLTSPILSSNVNTPSNISSDTILVTPVTLPTSLTAIHESPLEQSDPLSTLNHKEQPSIYPLPTSQTGNPFESLSLDVIASRPSTQDIRKERDDERRQAATSLKDVAAKQRGTKRAADPKSAQSQGRVAKKVRLLLFASRRDSVHHSFLLLAWIRSRREQHKEKSPVFRAAMLYSCTTCIQPQAIAYLSLWTMFSTQSLPSRKLVEVLSNSIRN